MIRIIVIYKNSTGHVTAMLLTWISCFFAIILVNGQHICPDPEDFSPCTCDYEAINCNYALDSGELRQAFKTYVKDVQYRYLWMSNTEIDKLSNDTFGKFKFQVLNLQYNRIKIVEVGVFAEMKSFVEEINLSHNQLTAIPNDAFYGMSRLNSVRLEFNFIKTVDVWPSLPLLYTIRLENNLIASVKPFAFSSLPSLLILEMSSNYLETLDDNVFATKQSESLLREIRLNENDITKISRTAFHGQLDSLSGIFLKKNKIQLLITDFWVPFIQNISSTGTIIDLSDNPIECTMSNLFWLLKYPDALKEHLVGIVCNEKPLSDLLESDLE